MEKRTFNPYELAQLTKHGFGDVALSGAADRDIPVEYITGRCEFMGRDFRVSRDTLIPRIETEELVRMALDFVTASGASEVSFADIGTGSGAIGISFAAEAKRLGVSASGVLADISENAATIARENTAVFLAESDRVPVVLSDLMSDIPGGPFGVIFANLPYVPSDNVARLDASVRDFEPVLALDGGPDGLDLVRRVLSQAEGRIAPAGAVFLEVDDSHVDASEFADRWNVDVRKDSFGNNRFWVALPK